MKDESNKNAIEVASLPHSAPLSQNGSLKSTVICFSIIDTIPYTDMLSFNDMFHMSLKRRKWKRDSR